MNISPNDYMMLIFNLTRDLSRVKNIDQRIRTYRNTQTMRTEQILTERGICYMSNNFLAFTLSAKYYCGNHMWTLSLSFIFYSCLCTRFLLTGEHPAPLGVDTIDAGDGVHVLDVLYGNLFDGDMGYNMVGFQDFISVFVGNDRPLLFRWTRFRPFQINVHSPFETINIGKLSFYANYAFEYHCYATEIIADQAFQRWVWLECEAFPFAECISSSRSTTVRQRHCRFNDESNLTHYRTYTQGLCFQECRLNLVYKLCHCIPHFYPNRSTNMSMYSVFLSH